MRRSSPLAPCNHLQSRYTMVIKDEANVAAHIRVRTDGHIGTELHHLF